LFFSDKLGNLTVALGVAGAGIALTSSSNASLQVGYTCVDTYGDRVQLMELRAM
jgi:hypothetical protein